MAHRKGVNGPSEVQGGDITLNGNDECNGDVSPCYGDLGSTVGL